MDKFIVFTGPQHHHLEYQIHDIFHVVLGEGVLGRVIRETNTYKNACFMDGNTMKGIDEFQ